jgi:perosamine synthetase
VSGSRARALELTAAAAVGERDPVSSGPPTLGRAAGSPFRAQPPVHSPVPLGAALAAGAELIRSADPRPELLHALCSNFLAESGVLLASGTQALRVALDLAVRRAGGKTAIAVPAFSCYDVASAAVASGAPIRLYDLDPATLQPDPASFERALAAGARVAVAAPLYGVPLPWEELQRRADTHGAVLVEDAAQGSGASWQGRPLGSFGSLSVFSFGRGKGWTGGRGGALLLRGDFAVESAPSLLAERFQEARTVAAAVAQALLARPSLYRVPLSIPWLRLGETVFRQAAEPAEMPRTAAALLLRTQNAARAESEARRRNAAEFLASLPDRAGIRPILVPRDASPGYLRLPLRLRHGMTGFPDVTLARRMGIVAGYPGTLASLAALRPRITGGAACPGAEELTRTLVTLPVHSRLREADREQVLRLVHTYRS